MMYPMYRITNARYFLVVLCWFFHLIKNKSMIMIYMGSILFLLPFIAAKSTVNLFVPEVAKYIHSSSDSDEYRVDHYSRALESLASTQNAIKSVDGLTHQLKNTFNDASTLQARYEAFIDNDKHSAKEATKLFEYVNTVERALQAAEILQSISEKDEIKRLRYIEHCGLSEVKRVSVACGKYQCIVCVLRPLEGHIGTRYKPEELIIGIVDDAKLSMFQALKLLDKPERTMELKSVGLVNEEISVQPVLFDLALAALRQLKEYLDPTIDSSVISANLTVNVSTTVRPQLVRLMGYSVGGGVAALATMVLDGTLQTKDKDVQAFAGACRGRIKSLCLGPPPCISRSVISRNVASIICGDDCLPRATHETLETLKERVTGALKMGAGRGGLRGLGYSLGPGLFNDLTAVAGASLRQYTAGKHDLSALSVAGRVFFVKSRKHKQGGSIRRVLRGNWQEDVLWLLHEIMISKRMVEHHSLSSYISTLSRC